MKMKNKRKKVVPHGLKRKDSKKEWGSILEGVPKNSPSLSQAYQLTQRASRVGFDWPNIEGVLNKLDEEMGEFREALSLQNRRRIREEIGDLLFVMANVSRFLEINPEEALKNLYLDFIILRYPSRGKGNPSSSLTSSKWTDYGRNQKRRKPNEI
jgi:uncharacterized protein YabN with tetrapyrrole methylase and pyrophosphatase domain